MPSPKAVGSFFIETASELKENDLTNLKLQKIMFYAQVESLRRYNERLFEESIQAWKYGPVVPSVYSWLKECGSYTISIFDIPTKTDDLSDEDRDFLSEVWEKYGKYSASYLVAKTHEPGSPWATVYDEDVHGIVIPLDLVIQAKTADEW